MKIFYLIAISSLAFELNAQQPVTPQKNTDGSFLLSVGDVYFQVNPDHGARIESYKLGETEFLFLERLTGAEDMYGSTSWLSPQSLWGWPPQTEIDKEPYVGGISGNNIILTSEIATANNNFKFQIRKKFSADLQDSSVTVNYTVINKTTSTKSFASWEIMRVPSGGLSFFPVNGEVTGKLAPMFIIENDIAWWDFDSTRNIFEKAFADGREGWLAHIDNNRLIHIKKFTDAASNFPSNTEKEIEYWAESGRNYTEIEKHTDYRSIPAGDSTTLAIKWYLRKLPDHIGVSSGNPEIIEYVNSIIKSGTTSIYNSIHENTFAFYPNPTSGKLIFQGSTVGEQAEFLLLNILGKPVANQTLTSGEMIDLQFLVKGVYIYKIQSEGKISTGKLIIRN
jgi:hypothetical protein